MAVKFHFQAKADLKNRRLLKSCIENLAGEEGFRIGSLDIIFCDDEYLLKINRQFLEHDYYTDIITFDLSETPGELSGELYISIEMVAANANRYQVEYSEELRRVIFHGILHLCGYNDKTTKEVKIIRSKEEYYLKMFHVKQKR